VTEISSFCIFVLVAVAVAVVFLQLLFVVVVLLLFLLQFRSCDSEQRAASICLRLLATIRKNSSLHVEIYSFVPSIEDEIARLVEICFSLTTIFLSLCRFFCRG